MSQRLSARQEECLRLTAFLTDKEIAVRLGLSEATIKKHVHEACRRLGVNRRKAALALLERNVPRHTKDPIGDDGRSSADDSLDRESDNGIEQYAASPLDLGGPGGGAGRVQPAGRERSGPQPSVAGAGGRRGAVDSEGTAAAGAERGLGHGPGRSPERRLGYRPPPRGWGVRLLIIAILVIVFALMVKGIADTILAYTERAGAIGRALDSGAPAERPAPPPAPA